MWHSIAAPGATDRTHHRTIRPTASLLIRRPPGSMKTGDSLPAGGRAALAGAAHRAPTIAGRTSRT
jgi:hypothetical protein